MSAKMTVCGEAMRRAWSARRSVDALARSTRNPIRHVWLLITRYRINRRIRKIEERSRSYNCPLSHEYLVPYDPSDERQEAIFRELLGPFMWGGATVYLEAVRRLKSDIEAISQHKSYSDVASTWMRLDEEETGKVQLLRRLENARACAMRGNNQQFLAELSAEYIPGRTGDAEVAALLKSLSRQLAQAA